MSNNDIDQISRMQSQNSALRDRVTEQDAQLRTAENRLRNARISLRGAAWDVVRTLTVRQWLTIRLNWMMCETLGRLVYKADTVSIWLGKVQQRAANRSYAAAEQLPASVSATAAAMADLEAAKQ